MVHGGGVQLTRTLAQMGKKSEFISGLRITDAETRDAALMVLAGRVNKSLVAALGSAWPVRSRPLRRGRPRLPRTQKENYPRPRLRWRDRRHRPRWLDAIWAMGAVPVISSIALGFDGEYYNINADEMAAACAIGTKADALVFLTDVPGVKGADGTVMRWLTLAQIPAMEKLKSSSPAACSPNSTPAATPSPTASSASAFSRQKPHLLPDLVSRASTMERRSWSHEQIQSIQAAEKKLLLNTYERNPILFVSGEGVSPARRKR